MEIKIITAGPYKNKLIEAEYALSMSFNEKQDNTDLKPGDEVWMILELGDGGEICQAYIYRVARDKYLLLLLIIFSVIILSVGRLKGLKALITLVLTVLAIIYVLLPLILKGFDPVFLSIWICIAIAGGSLQLMLLLMAHQMPFHDIINQDGYATEIVRSLAGSIGLILTIPITAVTAGFFSEKREIEEERY